MNYQAIFYDNEENISINHVEYFDQEPDDVTIFLLAENNNSKYIELFEDINDDDEYKSIVASFHL